MKKQVFKLSEVGGIPSPRGRARVGVKQKVAFTLAEVLITLGIIGVVAALTLPSLIQKQHEKETVAKVKKAYSILSQAYLSANTEFGSFDQWGITTGMNEKESHIIFGNNMKKFMKLTKDCVGQSNDYTDKNCYIKGRSANINIDSRVVLSDGSLILFKMYSNSCKSQYVASGKVNTCGVINLYTNPKKETQYGKNVFTVFITKEGTVVPEGAPNGVHKFNRACNKNIATPYPNYSNSNMYGCTAWVIYNENMDYWHCDGLDWGGKTRCK